MVSPVGEFESKDNNIAFVLISSLIASIRDGAIPSSEMKAVAKNKPLIALLFFLITLLKNRRSLSKKRGITCILQDFVRPYGRLVPKTYLIGHILTKNLDILQVPSIIAHFVLIVNAIANFLRERV
ncbi:MAG TPA: hypothetical protein PK263_04285 [bacterium]|nr:hypothetical protein [bacterium]